jgi:hypothetical protein
MPLPHLSRLCYFAVRNFCKSQFLWREPRSLMCDLLALLAAMSTKSGRIPKSSLGYSRSFLLQVVMERPCRCKCKANLVKARPVRTKNRLSLDVIYHPAILESSHLPQHLRRVLCLQRVPRTLCTRSTPYKAFRLVVPHKYNTTRPSIILPTKG